MDLLLEKTGAWEEYDLSMFLPLLRIKTVIFWLDLFYLGLMDCQQILLPLWQEDAGNIQVMVRREFLKTSLPSFL